MIIKFLKNLTSPTVNVTKHCSNVDSKAKALAKSIQGTFENAKKERDERMRQHLSTFLTDQLKEEILLKIETEAIRTYGGIVFSGHRGECNVVVEWLKSNGFRAYRWDSKLRDYVSIRFK